MKRLSPQHEEALLLVLRKAAAGRPLDERQARCDFAGVLSLLAAYKGRPGRGRKAGPIRVLAELAADTYHAHTGKGPGRAIGHKGQICGLYPAFVRALAEAAAIPIDERALLSACREVQRCLNDRAGLPSLRGDPGAIAPQALGTERATARGQMMQAHLIGVDGNGAPVLEGYEPARDPDATGKETFAQFVKG